MSTSETRITDWFASQSRSDRTKFPIGIGDDMAQISLSESSSVLITTDMLLDGVHFDLQSAKMETIGYKVMAVSLSDCAAMATIPIAAVVSVALPRSLAEKELKELHNGIRRAGDKFDCVLIGGDITSWDRPLAISSTVISRPGKTKPVRRCGARPDDIICVTGSLGASLAGRHLEFVPRIYESLAIAEAGANSMIDLSDGLSSDLNHICRQSGVAATIEADKIPLSAEAEKSDNPINSALNDGEDFELLFTIGESDYRNLKKNWQFQTAVTAIGTIGQTTDITEIRIRTAGGTLRNLSPAGYDHLKND